MDWNEILSGLINSVSAFFGAIIELLPVFAGALIGWMVSISNTKLNHRLQSFSEQTAELRKKLEELMYQCSDVGYLSEKQQSEYLFGKKQKRMRNQAAKIEAIASLYFPEIEEEARQLYFAVGKQQVHLLQVRRDILARKEKIPSDEERESSLQKYADVTKARLKLESAASNLMKDLRVEKPAANGDIRRWLNKLRRN